MANRLEPLNLVSYVGGLNLRADQFQLADDESPDMLNVDIDPRGGFYTRRGWQRWNEQSIVDLEARPTQPDFQPRNAFLHVHANDGQWIYIVEKNLLYSADVTAVFNPITGPNCQAVGHQADFGAWGDDLYVSCGIGQTSYRLRQPSTGPATVTAMAPETWSEVDAPTFNTTPRAEHLEPHAGYMFVAGTTEGGVARGSRLRWSHPGVPDAWRQSDFIDIDTGGGRITAIASFNDHLLIFKSNTMWALYGYDSQTWQLVRVSSLIGCQGPHSIGKSETACYFYSASSRGGIYGYGGTTPVCISENLRPAFENLLAYENVFVSWAGRRLWVTVPWRKDVGATSDPSTAFIYDPEVGQGAWVMYRSEFGTPAPVLDGSDVQAKFPKAALWSTEFAGVVILDTLSGAFDDISDRPVLATVDDRIISTVDGLDIGVEGLTVTGQPFEAYYRTRWLHAGWPERKKSWRRPTFICRGVDVETQLVVEAFRDYDETNVRRSRTLVVPVSGGAFWREDGFDDPLEHGFDWEELGKLDPRGANWGAATTGSEIVRSGSLGLARAVQLRVQSSTLTQRNRWGVDGIVAKFVMRRFR
jgi:hypothetical protein